MNDTGAQLYDNKGMAEGGLLTANDVGTNLYDFKGMAEGFLGTTTPPVVSDLFLRAMTGFGF